MLLENIKIDLTSFFNIDLIVFTTTAFLFSVLITTILVFGLNPITKKARQARGIKPEKMSDVYLRLIIYIVAEFIAFVSDMFLVIFGNNYKIPWATTVVFLTIAAYKLIFVLFKDFKDLGYNARGFKKIIKTASKVVIDRKLDSNQEILDEINKDDNDKES